MKNNINNSDLPGHQSGEAEKNNIKGYPSYPENEDIFNNSLIDIEINPEDISENKDSPNYNETGISNEKNCNDDESGDYLDIPGTEMDEDDDENIGTEDEENNYYSLGGDDHENLEEHLDD